MHSRPSLMTSNEIVLRFAILAAGCLEALRHEYVGMVRPDVGSPLSLLPRLGGKPVRSGELVDIGHFQIHGRGCRFELASGEDIDVDWDEDGRAVFDSWRILMLARSIGNHAVDRDSLRAAAIECPRFKPVREDWFTHIDRDFDIVWGDG